MLEQNLEFSSFLDMVDFDALCQSLKDINNILKEEQSSEYQLIMTIDTTYKLIQYLRNHMNDDNIKSKEKLEMISYIIIIHQDLTRILYDEDLKLSEKFYSTSRSVIERLVIFYPAFIFNNQIISHKQKEAE